MGWEDTKGPNFEPIRQILKGQLVEITDHEFDKRLQFLRQKGLKCETMVPKDTPPCPLSDVFSDLLVTDEELVNGAKLMIRVMNLFGEDISDMNNFVMHLIHKIKERGIYDASDVKEEFNFDNVDILEVE